MSIEWNFDADNVEEMDYAPLPVGNYRVRIAKAEEGTSKSGNDKIDITFDVSGDNRKLFFTITFLPDNKQFTDTRLNGMFEGFDIPKGNLNPNSWAGKVGGVRVKHEEYNGETKARVHYTLKPEVTEKLPKWQEPSNTSLSNDSDFEAINDDDCPI